MMGQDKGYPALNFDYNSEATLSSNGVVVNEHVKYVSATLLFVGDRDRLMCDMYRRFCVQPDVMQRASRPLQAYSRDWRCQRHHAEEY